MAGKRARSQKDWFVDRRRVGYVRDGVHYIDRKLPGRPRFRKSTLLVDPKAAADLYRRWEASGGRGVLPSPGAASGWNEAVPAYLKFSALTAQNSAGHVEKQGGYFDNLKASGLFHSLDTFTANDVRAYMAWRAGGGVGGRKVGRPAVNRDLAALKALMTWARKEGITFNTADQDVPQLKEDEGQNAPREVAEDDWRGVLSNLSERWRLAAMVILGAGLRYSELARMAPVDIHPGAIRVPLAKRRKARTIPASATTVQAARQLLLLGGVPDDEAGQMNHRLEVACRAACVERFSPHELRHTYATASLRNGVPLRDLQYRMGHASIRTTEQYLHAVEAEKQKDFVGAPL